VKSRQKTGRIWCLIETDAPEPPGLNRTEDCQLFHEATFSGSGRVFCGISTGDGLLIGRRNGSGNLTGMISIFLTGLPISDIIHLEFRLIISTGFFLVASLYNRQRAEFGLI
jgi:hypothetical protein